MDEPKGKFISAQEKIGAKEAVFYWFFQLIGAFLASASILGLFLVLGVISVPFVFDRTELFGNCYDDAGRKEHVNHRRAPLQTENEAYR